MTEIGRRIRGKYEILRLLGRGGTADVYLAQDMGSGRYFAIKKMRRDGRGTAAAQTEDMLRSLYHPGLPRVYETVEQGEAVYVVMDYVKGVSLGQLLQRERSHPQRQVIEWGKQLCKILIYLHSRRPPLVYRDLKPDNIMLQEDGKLKLIDFGTVVKGGKGCQNDCAGTRGYAAPEQYLKRGRIDQRTDIYCLGVTLHQLLTGFCPTCANGELPPIRRWDASYSRGLEKIIRKCTRRSKCGRYRSCRELLRALERLTEQ